MIDIEQHQDLVEYLLTHNLIKDKDHVTCSNLPGGVSNRTVLVEHGRSGQWVIKQALEKLRVEADWFSDPQRIHHEANGLRWLATLIGEEAVPGFIYEDDQEHILIMEAVARPHFNYKTLLLEQPPKANHAGDFANLLAAIHRHSFFHRDELASIFADTSFFESLRLEPYYGYAAGRVPEAADFLLELMQQTRTRKLTLVHGDYSPKNVLIYNDRLVLLDHEVIHFGDPAFDIGFSMAHFLSKAHYRADLQGTFIDTAQLYWQTYFKQTREEPWAVELEHFCVQHTLACLLARVAGKSMLEYLGPEQKKTQQQIITDMIGENHASMTSAINRFSTSLERYQQHSKT